MSGVSWPRGPVRLRYLVLAPSNHVFTNLESEIQSIQSKRFFAVREFRWIEVQVSVILPARREDISVEVLHAACPVATWWHCWKTGCWCRTAILRFLDNLANISLQNDMGLWRILPRHSGHFAGSSSCETRMDSLDRLCGWWQLNQVALQDHQHQCHNTHQKCPGPLYVHGQWAS